MAEGYDNRQSGRASFAFAQPQAYQARSTNGGQSAGARVQGGNSASGIETAGPITAPTDSDVPAFLDKMMQPYVERKQQEQFFKGFTAAQSGVALDEIHNSQGGFSRIFGPSHFEEGAAAYTGQDRVNTGTQELYADMDNLKRLSPGEFSKVLASKSQEWMTGNSLADQIIQKGAVDAFGPLIKTQAKARYVFGQESAMAAANTQADSGESLYQEVARTQAGLSAPGDKPDEAFTQQTTTFLRSYMKPDAMDEDTYQTFLFQRAKAMQAKGNFFGFHALRDAGVMEHLTEEQRTKLETGYDTSASKALGDVAHDPQVVKMRLALDADIKLGRVTAPLEASARLEDINALVARKTGIKDDRLYDASAVVSVGTAVTDAAISAKQRRETRQWQIEDREDSQQFQIDEKEREAARDAASANLAIAGGQARTGLATGLGKEADYNVIFGNMMTKGDYGTIARNFDRETYKNDYAADLMQSGVKASMGTGLTGGFQKSHERWAALYKESPSAASAYMGEYAAQMEGYDNALKGGDTALSAYAQTFGNPASSTPVSLPIGIDREEMSAAVAKAITAKDSMLGGWIKAGRTPLSEGSTNRLAEWVLRKAGSYARTAGISIEAAATRIYDRGIASGEIERAGPLAWTNLDRRPPLSRIMGQPDDRIDEAISAVVGDKLKAAGFGGGINARNIMVQRLQDRGGVAALYIIAMQDDGSGHVDIPINSAELSQWLKRKAGKSVAAANAHTGRLFPARE